MSSWCPVLAIWVFVAGLVALVPLAPLAAQTIETDGDVKAKGFEGDGSKLTNLRADAVGGLDSATVACIARTLEGRVFTEIEPNDSAATATPHCLGRGSGIVGGVENDWYSTQAEAGFLVFAWADTTFSPFVAAPVFDSFLDLFAADGTTLIESDDDDGTPLLSAVIAGAVVPQAGRVFTRVTEPNGGSITYRLYQVVVDPADTQAETEPNDNVFQANVVGSQTLITGHLPSSPILTADWFQFFAPSVSRINVIVDEDPDNDGLPTSVKVGLVFPDGVTPMGAGSTAGANNTPPDAEAYGGVTVFAGNHYLAITNAGGGTDADGDYRLVIQVIPGEG